MNEEDVEVCYIHVGTDRGMACRERHIEGMWVRMDDDSVWEQLFVPTSLAYLIMAGGGGVILDLGRDEFLGLNPLAQDIWMHLTAGKTPREIVQVMSRRYAVAATHVRADLAHFIAALENRGLLMRHDRVWRLPDCAMPPLALDALSLEHFPALPDGVAMTSHWQHPSWLEAWACLHHVDDLLKRVRLYRFAQALVALPAQRTITATEADIHELAAVVADAAEWAPFHAACLHQSLALAWMLRQRYFDVDVVMGVYTHPFSAHVWLESAGQIVQWRTGMGYTADIRRLEAMFVIFHTRTLPSLTGRTHI